MNRDWHIIKEGEQQIGVGFPEDLEEDTIQIMPDMDGGDWIRLTVAEIDAIHALVEAEVTRRGALAEQERMDAEAQGVATREAIDRMSRETVDWLSDDSLTARCKMEAVKRGWTE